MSKLPDRKRKAVGVCTAHLARPNMSGWLGRKFQNQLKNQDLTHKALSKLQQIENCSNKRDKQGKTIQNVSSQCPNCSSMSGLNNTVSVTINPNLLANTQLGNLTTLEEVTRDPGFQDFLSAQLQLYFKFICNSANNTLLAAAQSRATLNSNGQSCNSSATDTLQRTHKPSSSRDGICMSQEVVCGPLDPTNRQALSLPVVEEEHSRELQDQQGRVQRVDCQVAVETVNKLRTSSASQCSNESPIKAHTTRGTVNRAIPGNSNNSRNQTTSTNLISEPPERSFLKAASKRGRRAAPETEESCSQQLDSDAFKVPLPPKPKISRPRSSSKRNETTRAKPKEDERKRAGSQKSEFVRVPSSIAPSQNSEQTDSSYRSRTGRISKPPGSFWNPRQDTEEPDSRARKSDYSRKVAASDKTNPKVRRTEVVRSEMPVTGFDSESGYSSVSARKPAQGRKTNRLDALTESEEKQRAVKPKHNIASARAVPEDSQEEQGQTTIQDKKILPARRGRLATADIEKPQKVAAKRKEAAKNLHSEAPLAARRTAPKRKADPEPVVNHIFSDSNSSIDESVISNATIRSNRNRRQGSEVSRVVQQKKRVANWLEATVSDKLAVVDGSSDDSDSDRNRKPPPKAAPVTAASSKLPVQQTEKRGVEVESSSEEEDTTAARKRGVGRKEASEKRQIEVESRSEEADTTAAKKRGVGRKEASEKRQIEVESSSEEEDTTVVKRPAAGKKKESKTTKTRQRIREKEPGRHRGRFLFGGSSTEEEDSISSYQATSRNKKKDNEGSGSLLDDASYISGTRESREREFPFVPQRSRRINNYVSRFRM